MPDKPVTPLLPPGLHPMKRSEVKRLGVDAFPDSATRGQIALGLFFILDRLAQSRVTGEAWLNGSFVTDKEDPADADIVFMIPAEQYQKGSPRQQEAIEWIAENLRGVLHCDTYVALTRLPNDPAFAEAQENVQEWLDLYTTSRDGTRKGIIVLKVG